MKSNSQKPSDVGYYDPSSLGRLTVSSIYPVHASVYDAEILSKIVPAHLLAEKLLRLGKTCLWQERLGRNEG